METLDRTQVKDKNVYASRDSLRKPLTTHFLNQTPNVSGPKNKNNTYFCFTNSSVISFLTSPKSECLTLAIGKITHQH
jgi:hypothetical protein